MLVLSRKNNESIIIGDNIEVYVVDISPTAVKLGIKAPHSIPVHRKEIFDVIQAENIKASKSEVVDISLLGSELLKLKKEQDAVVPDNDKKDRKKQPHPQTRQDV